MTSGGLRRALATAISAALIVTLNASGAMAGTGTPSPLKGDARTRAEATVRASIMLDRVHIPGAVRLPPPAGSISFASGDPQVELTRDYAVAGNRDAVIHQVRVHPPMGFHNFWPPIHWPAPGPGRGGATSIDEVPADRPYSRMHDLSFLATEEVPGHVVITVQASVSWSPNRDKLETIPRAVDTGNLVSDFRLGYADVTLKGDQVHTLARQLNALRAKSTWDSTDCTLGPLPVTATLSVFYGGHHVWFAFDLGDCFDVKVTVDGVTKRTLIGSAQLATEVRRMVKRG